VVGAIPVHLIAGIWGTLAVPITNSEGSFVTQLIGIGAIGTFVVISSTIVWQALRLTTGIRPSQEQESNGLDMSEIGLEAYPEFGQGSQRV
jgi:Amt family ammonium transporter